MAAHCDLRDPGWGDPGFPQCALLLLSPPVAILILLFGLVVLFRIDGRCSAWHTRCCRDQFLRANSYSFMACFFRLLFFVFFCWFLCLVFVFVCLFFLWFLVPLVVLCSAHEAWECSLDYVQVRNCPLLWPVYLDGHAW